MTSIKASTLLRFPIHSRWIVKNEPGKGAVATVVGHDHGTGGSLSGEVCFEMFGGVQWFPPERAEEVFEPISPKKPD